MTKTIFAVLIAASTSSLIAQEMPRATVTMYDGKTVPLAKEVADSFEKTAVRLLKGSYENSNDKDLLAKLGGINGIHDQYRENVQKTHLVISFKEPESIQTMRGVFIVNEIVVGLGGPHITGIYAIDSEGRLVSFTQYNGFVGVDMMAILKQVDDAAAKTSNQ